MNQVLCNPKIKPEHLARRAIVYLRQSSEKQVRQNKESQRLQYDVAERMAERLRELQLLCHSLSEWCHSSDLLRRWLSIHSHAAGSRQMRLRLVHTAFNECSA